MRGAAFAAPLAAWMSATQGPAAWFRRRGPACDAGSRRRAQVAASGRRFSRKAQLDAGLLRRKEAVVGAGAASLWLPGDCASELT